MTRTIQILAAIGGLVLAGYIYWATSVDFFASVDHITSNRWGQVTLVDLYLGFVLLALLIAAFEKKVGMAIIWIVPIFFLGNVWAAAWFIVRAPLLVQRLRG